MSCSRELRELLKDTEKSRDSEFKDGYIVGLEEALEIVERHEDEGE